MNITRHLKLESSIVSSTLFIAGIITSAGALYEHQADSAKVSMGQIWAHIGLTFLMGLFAIHFTARSVRQTVLYLAQKKEKDTTLKVSTEDQSQLAMDALSRILTSQKDISQDMVNELSRQLEAGQTGLYVAKGTTLELKLGYALAAREKNYTCNYGDGLVGRVAQEGNALYIDKLPEGYITIHSGLGSASPKYLAIVPLKVENETKGVLEIALFRPLTPTTIDGLENIGKAWAAAGL